MRGGEGETQVAGRKSEIRTMETSLGIARTERFSGGEGGNRHRCKKGRVRGW